MLDFYLMEKSIKPSDILNSSPLEFDFYIASYKKYIELLKQKR